MHSITVTNVNRALHEVLWRVRTCGVEEATRNGPVLRLAEPLCVTYTRPWERVLFAAERDANPFFHFMEAMWMLAGRKDVAFLAQFNSRIADYSDDGVTLPASYGWRWRNYFDYDQLEALVNLLKKEPTTRRALLCMWDPCVDLEIAIKSKDVPCNTTAMFQLNAGKLDMMVTNRSNDVVWGLCGANAVHMSYLLEYVAAAVGVPMGVYHQVTFNAHVYLNEQGKKLLAQPPLDDRYEQGVQNVALPKEGLLSPRRTPSQPWLTELYDPIYGTWVAHKQADNKATTYALSRMVDCDWKIACTEWLQRRGYAAS